MFHFDFITESNSFLKLLRLAKVFLILDLSFIYYFFWGSDYHWPWRKRLFSQKRLCLRIPENSFETVYVCSGCFSESSHTEICTSTTLLQKWDLSEMLFKRSISWSWRNSISQKGDMVIQVFFLMCIFLIRSLLV